LSFQGKFKNKLDQVTEKDDAGDMQLGGSFDKSDHAVQAVNAEENKQKRKKAKVTNRKNSKLTNRGRIHVKGSGASQQCTNTSICIVEKSKLRNNNTKENNTSSRRNKVSVNRNRNLSSNNGHKKAFAPPNDDLDVEAPVNELLEKSSKKDKRNQQKKSGRKLEITWESAVHSAESKSEQRTKRMRRMLDSGIAQKIRVVSEFENGSERPQPHNLLKGCTQHKTLSGIGQKSMESNIGGKTPHIGLGRCQSSVAIDTAPSEKNVLVMNDGSKYTEQSDCSGTVKSRTARSALSKKCENKVQKLFCVFCKSGDITEVHVCLPVLFFQVPIIPLTNENLISFKESGEMVHYHNGKQVRAEFNGGANVIHSHKNCLEWYVTLSNTRLHWNNIIYIFKYT
jgi:BRCA1-associated RING domain protein 1